MLVVYIQTEAKLSQDYRKNSGLITYLGFSAISLWLYARMLLFYFKCLLYWAHL